MPSAVIGPTRGWDLLQRDLQKPPDMVPGILLCVPLLEHREPDGPSSISNPSHSVML